MRFFFDNCTSPRIAHALDALDEHHSVVALQDKFSANATDQEWLAQLAREGADWVVISADPTIMRPGKGRHERAAWLEAGLTTFFLEPKWQHIKLWKQAGLVIKWWPIITNQALNIEAGATFFVPVRGEKLRQVR